MTADTMDNTIASNFPESKPGGGEGYGGDYGETFGAQLNGNQQKKKVTSPRDCIDSMCTNVNYDLLVSKTFYFFFFAAFGSLFPLLGVYFKQLGMNATQCGIIIGFRPFIEFCSAPLWGGIADKWKKGKQLLLISVFFWVLSTLIIAFMQPTPYSCLSHNTTHFIIEDPYQDNARRRRDVTQLDEEMLYQTVLPDLHSDTFHEARNGEFPSREKRTTDGSHGKNPNKIYVPPRVNNIGKSPVTIDHTKIANKDYDDLVGLVSPPYSSVIYRAVDIQQMFLLILIVVIIGEFLSAPAIALADAATLGYLGEDTENYGKQRMFGSLGWGVSMFLVGIALDHSDVFSNHPCAQQVEGEKNYIVCFTVFTVFMSCAWLSATQFRFSYGNHDDNIPLEQIKEKLKDKFDKKVLKIKKVDRDRLIDDDGCEEDYLPPANVPRNVSNENSYQDSSGGVKRSDSAEKKIQISVQAGEGGSAMPDMVSDAVHHDHNRPSPYIPRGQPGQAGTMPEWMTVLRMFGTVRYGSVLWVVWYMGFGVGLVFTFLFWHLQDLGGSPTLFGIASVITHVSEILAYFFSNKLIAKVGHVKVLYIGLLCNIARFLYISFLRNPWWVLPFEFLQGLTHAAVWAASCSYITQATPDHLRATAQGILQGIHHGLGRGCGAVIGGILVYYFGTEMTFRGYGIACVVVIGMFGGLHYYNYKRGGKMDPDAEEPHQVLEETAHLAPCGVPMSLSRNLSSSKLEEMDHSQDYGATKGTNGFLAPGGATSSNFPQSGGMYQGGGYNQYHGDGYNQSDSTKGQSYSLQGVTKHLQGGGGSLSLAAKPNGMQLADYELIRRNFEAYKEAMNCIDRPKSFTRSLIMQPTPSLNTEMHMLQPENKACLLSEDDDDEEWF